MILSGWKEIAQYLRCGVRTAQRWQSKGLPVRRAYPGPRAPVLAVSEEIDVWRGAGTFPVHRKDPYTREIVMRSQALRAQVRQSRETLHRTIDQLKKTWEPIRLKKN